LFEENAERILSIDVASFIVVIITIIIVVVVAATVIVVGIIVRIN
jgi:hypothetical protein